MTDPPNRPLWEVMCDASFNLDSEVRFTPPMTERDRLSCAAEIRAIAEKAQAEFGEYFTDGDPVLLKVINWLRIEADRAEAGE